MIKWLESKFALLDTLVIKTPDLNVEGWGERGTFFLLWNPAQKLAKLPPSNPSWLNIYLHQSISVSIHVRTS